LIIARVTLVSPTQKYRLIATLPNRQLDDSCETGTDDNQITRMCH